MIDFCKIEGIKRNAARIEIANRILKYLEAGEVITQPAVSRFGYSVSTVKTGHALSLLSLNSNHVRYLTMFYDPWIVYESNVMIRCLIFKEYKTVSLPHFHCVSRFNVSI
ncbi:MAG: hypothetical protein ACOH2V_13865 [Candidatus Saccharimonadaceae bacterium]